MVLRDAGLVEDQRDGWNIFYRVVRPEIFKVLEAMNSLTGQMSRGESIPALGKPKKTCPCPKCNPDKVSGKC
jgi:ArsR family transcriptional regulator